MLEEIVVRDGRRVAFNAHKISEAITAAFGTVGHAASGLLYALGDALVECAHNVSDYSARGTHRLFRFMISIAHDLAHLLLHCLCVVATGIRMVETYDRDAVAIQDAATDARMDALAAAFLGSVQPIRKGAMIRRQDRGSTEPVSEDDNRKEMYRGRGGNCHPSRSALLESSLYLRGKTGLAGPHDMRRQIGCCQIVTLCA